MCPTHESSYGLIVLGDVGGGGMDEYVEEGQAFSGLIAVAQATRNDLIECIGDEDQLLIQVSPHGNGAIERVHPSEVFQKPTDQPHT